jgi:hypothetical protein
MWPFKKKIVTEKPMYGITMHKRSIDIGRTFEACIMATGKPHHSFPDA